jgi:CRISPR-associated endonuclease Cas2
MLHLACYDIEKDRLRTKLADKLLEYGFERIQFSVFLGTLRENRKEELLEWVEKLLESTPPAERKFLLMPLAEAHALKSVWIAETDLDWDWLTGKQHTLII